MITDITMNSLGAAATATATIGTGFVQSIDLLNDGSGFTSVPTIGLTTAPSGGIDATAVGIITTRNNITSIEEIVTIGATVYPAPEFVMTISSMEVTLFLVFIIPIAVASIPPLGAVVNPIVGALVNPDPSLSKSIL